MPPKRFVDIMVSPGGEPGPGPAEGKLNEMNPAVVRELMHQGMSKEEALSVERTRRLAMCSSSMGAGSTLAPPVAADGASPVGSSAAAADEPNGEPKSEEPKGETLEETQKSRMRWTRK